MSKKQLLCQILYLLISWGNACLLMCNLIILQSLQINMANQLKLFDNQVSGKTAKFTDLEGKEVYKELSKTQYHFYDFMNNLQVHESQYDLKKFIPKFKGKKYLQTLNVAINSQDTSKKGQWINHISDRRRSDITQPLSKQYIALQNLAAGYRYPCVMDIKLGKKKVAKSSNKKFQNSTTNTHHFRINGMTNLFVKQNQPHFISKYYFQKTSQQQIQTHLAFFFYDGQSIDQDLVQKCIDQIKDIVLSLMCFKAGNFDSASLLIMYDAYDHSKFAVKVIDFDKYYPYSMKNQYGDQNIIVGLKYIIWYLNNIEHQHQAHEQAIRNKKVKFFDSFQVVPQEKKNQFTPKSQKDKKQKSSETSSPHKDSLTDIQPEIQPPELDLVQKLKN